VSCSAVSLNPLGSLTFVAPCTHRNSFAYVYILRTFSLTSFASLPPSSTERNTMAEMTAQLLPFLVEKSTLVLEDVGSALEYVVAREEVDVG
jgi:hypothetical protein